jgi:hypothetical protein
MRKLQAIDGLNQIIGSGCRTAKNHLPIHQYFKAAVTPKSEYCEIWVNGERVGPCIEADARQGWALVYVTDRCGWVLHDELGNPRTKTIKGAIEIRFAPPNILAGLAFALTGL